MTTKRHWPGAARGALHLSQLQRSVLTDRTPSRTSAKKSAKPKTPTPGFAARKVAVDVLGNVVWKRRPLDSELDTNSGHSGYRELSIRDRSLVRAILGAALRHRGQINVLLERVLDRRIPEKTGRVLDILHVAMAQIVYLDIPDRAAVSIAVDLASADRRARPYKGLVNGVLRRLGREREALLEGLENPKIAAPDWLFERWASAYGMETARAIAAAHLTEAAVDLTVKSNPEDWAARLGGALVGAGSVRISPKGPIDQLEGFELGEWWVQDAAASLPARLLGDVAGMKVADLCAAPGGKTAQLAAAGASVTAVDISKSRMKRVKENFDRLNLTAEIVAADLKNWEPAKPFDAVLLDAPCSATGTIRRHPDVQHLKQPQDIETLAEIQREILQRTAEWVKPGGLLVYCTCSMEPQEGEDQAVWFLENFSGFKLVPIRPEEVGDNSAFVSSEGYLRTLPYMPARADRAETGVDGFFAARFRRFNDA